MPTTRQHMHLGVFVLGTGNHAAGWRYPGAVDSFESLDAIQHIARTAERGLFDLLFLGDGLAANLDSHPSFAARFEPITMLSALAVTTTHLGLGATMSTTYCEPYQVARFFASLDHLSGGRAAWNAVTTSGGEAAANFGRDHPRHGARYDIAEEFVDVVRGLWDCWEDGAIVADRRTGRYFDTDRIHTLNHEGRYFRVKGPLNISRTPQGRPVILQAGSSEPGQALAARTADAVFSVTQDLEEARAFRTGFHTRLAGFGRAPSDVAILPGVMPIIGDTPAEARAELERLQSFVGAEDAMAMLRYRLGADMSAYPLDGPVPDLPLPDTSHGFARVMLAKARREGMTVRDLYNLTAAARGHWVVCGTPAMIADTLEEWFTTGGADGFNILPPYFHGAFDRFVDQVVPELQRRGLYRRAYEGRTLREHLGLPRPEVSGQPGHARMTLA